MVYQNRGVVSKWQLQLEAQGPCTGHMSIIAILYCFSFEYMKSTQIYVD